MTRRPDRRETVAALRKLGRQAVETAARAVVWRNVAMGLAASLLAAGPMAAAQEGGSSEGREGAQTPPSAQKIIATVHDLRYDETTERGVEESLRRQVLSKAREWSGLPISEGQIVREMLWLLRQEGVQQTRSQSVDPLTGRRTIQVELTLPLELVERWLPQLRERYLKRYRTLLAGWAATAGLWLVAALATVVVDRLTGGYRRGWLIPGALCTAAGLTAAGWWYLYEAVLNAPYAG